MRARRDGTFSLRIAQAPPVGTPEIPADDVKREHKWPRQLRSDRALREQASKSSGSGFGLPHFLQRDGGEMPLAAERDGPRIEGIGPLLNQPEHFLIHLERGPWSCCWNDAESAKRKNRMKRRYSMTTLSTWNLEQR